MSRSTLEKASREGHFANRAGSGKGASTLSRSDATTSAHTSSLGGLARVDKKPGRFVSANLDSLQDSRRSGNTAVVTGSQWAGVDAAVTRDQLGTEGESKIHLVGRH